MTERDGWCTPKWLCDLLPKVDLDPCSNSRSHVKACTHIVLEAFDEGVMDRPAFGFRVGDGLKVSWTDRSVFVNPPYSSIMPWALKAREASAYIYLVNLDPSTRWHQELVRAGGSYRFEFDKRIKFEAPPGITTSSNTRPQALICNREGWQMVGDKLDGHGRWWIEHFGYMSGIPKDPTTGMYVPVTEAEWKRTSESTGIENIRNPWPKSS